MATPLRLLLLPPEVMMTNRVIRRFGEEYALRCVFRDDNGQRLVSKEFSRGLASRGFLFCFFWIFSGNRSSNRFTSLSGVACLTAKVISYEYLF